MSMGKSDLHSFITKASKGDLANGSHDGEEHKGEGGREQSEIDEEMLQMMCKMSKLSNGNNVKLQGGNGMITRKNGGGLQGGFGQTKNIV